MAALKRLLVATDFSVMASLAAERAALIARHTGALLEVLHVSRREPLDALRQLADGDPDDGEPGWLETANEKLRRHAAPILQRHDLACTMRVTRGALIEQLAGHARDLPADLVVLGFCGASLMRHFLLGSTAERLVTQAFCPLLVVKQAAASPYRSVLVAVDFSAISLPTLMHARLVAPDAEIALLHVFDVPFEGKLCYAGVAAETINRQRMVARQQATRKLLALCEAAKIPPSQVRLLVCPGRPSQQIVIHEKSRNCDLIVIGKQGRSAPENLLIGSVTRQVMTRSLCDVLITV